MEIYAVAAIGLVLLGVYALIAYRSLLRKVLALNVMGSGVFLLLGSVAQRNGQVGADGVPDPVPHAMVLTGIVIAVSATAFALALARRIESVSGRVTLSEEEGLE